MSFNWGNSSQFSNNNKDRGPKLDDVVDVVKYPKGEYGSYRFIGQPRPTAMIWLNTRTKKKDGSGFKINSFPVPCLGFDPKTMDVHPDACPYLSAFDLSPRVEVRQNAIDRDLQENEPRKSAPLSKTESKLVEWNGGKWHVKDGKSKGGWTPVVVVPVIPSIGNQLAELTTLNKHKVKGEKKVFGPDHPRYGFDVMIKYNKDAKSPANMYIVQKGEITELTDDEKGYAIWDIPEHPNPYYEDTSFMSEKELKDYKKKREKALKLAEKEVERIKPYICDRQGNLLFPELENEGKKGKKKNQYKDNFDDDDDDYEEKKSKKSKKSRSDDDDDDDGEWESGAGDEDDDEDEDEDERPRRSKSKSKSKSKVKSKTKSKKSRHFDDDDDSDDIPF